MARVIELRVVGPDDWRVWRALRLDALAGAPEAFGSRLADWQGSGDREARWRDRLSIRGALDLIAFVDDVPVGAASGVPTDAAGCRELISMWVTPGVRGRGVGDDLVCSIANWASAQGASMLQLSVKELNLPARRLYDRHGFVDSGLPVNDEGELVLVKQLPADAS